MRNSWQGKFWRVLLVILGVANAYEAILYVNERNWVMAGLATGAWLLMATCVVISWRLDREMKQARRVAEQQRLAQAQLARAFAPNAFLRPSQSQQRDTPFIGFRAWRAEHVGNSRWLRGVAVQVRWETGVNKAVCLRSAATFPSTNVSIASITTQGMIVVTTSGTSSNPPIATVGGQFVQPAHDAPQSECTCGLYSLAKVEKAFDFVNGHQWPCSCCVLGATVAWGRVEQHGDAGWRAEYAKVLAILDRSTIPTSLTKRPAFKKDELSRLMAEVYQVPLLSYDSLEVYAKEYGDLLPDAE